MSRGPSGPTRPAAHQIASGSPRTLILFITGAASVRTLAFGTGVELDPGGFAPQPPSAKTTPMTAAVLRRLLAETAIGG